MKQKARKICSTSSLTICILHNNWGNKIKDDMGGIFNMNGEDVHKNTVLLLKIFTAFLTSLKELIINQDCILQIFAGTLVTVTHFKAHACRNHKKIYGTESFPTNYGISSLFLNMLINP